MPLLLFCSFFVFCVSCTTVKVLNTSELKGSQGTLLALPTAAELVVQYVDPMVQNDLEIASPASLQRAVNRIYETAVGFSKEKQFQLTLAVRLMRLLYPLE